MDNTFLYRELCRAVREQNSLSESEDPVNVSQHHQKKDAFTHTCTGIYTEAKQLAAYLYEVRKTYLTSASEADDIDVYVREIITSLMTRIRQLETHEHTQFEAELHSGSALARFVRFADAKVEHSRKALNLHRNGMLCTLNDQLKHVSDLQAQQSRARVEREMHRAKSSLEYVPPSERTGALALERELGAQHDSEFQTTVSHELMLELEQENSTLLQEMHVTQDKVRQAEKSMIEIAELQTQLAAHLSSQNDMIRSLMEDAVSTTEQVGAANTQLAQARKRNRFASKVIIGVSLFLGTVLLVLDAL